MNIEGTSFAEAFQLISEKTDRYPEIKKYYTELVDKLQDYTVSTNEQTN